MKNSLKGLPSMSRTIYSGIDYSLTSPCVAVYDSEQGEFSFENCKFYFLTETKSMMTTWKNIHGNEYPLYKGDEERYHKISEWVSNCFDGVTSDDIVMIGIEGYSMGSTGRVFNLAENCGLLKWKFWAHNIPFQIHPPTVIKKFATGKGNADKNKMYEAFVQETGQDISAMMCPKKSTIGNPISDIVDAYYILKYTYLNNS